MAASPCGFRPRFFVSVTFSMCYPCFRYCDDLYICHSDENYKRHSLCQVVTARYTENQRRKKGRSRHEGRVIAVGRDGITCEDAKGRTYGFDWIHVQGPTGDDVDDVHETATEHGEHKPAEHHEPERTDFKKGFDPESFRELDSAIFALEVGPVIAEHLHKAQPAHSDHERFTLLDAHIAAFQKGEYRNRK